MVVGSKDAIAEARIYRKALGGGMRQAGVLAAAGLIALEKMTLRLAEDHAHARMIAEELAGSPEFEIDLEAVQTNILIIGLKRLKSSDLVVRLKKQGVLIGATGPRAVRVVTHHDVDEAACRKAAEMIVKAAESDQKSK